MGNEEINIKVGTKTALWIVLGALALTLIGTTILGYKYYIAKKKLNLIENSDSRLSDELLKRRSEVDSLLGVNGGLESELVRKNKYIRKLEHDEAKNVTDYLALSPAAKDSTLAANLRGK